MTTCEIASSLFDVDGIAESTIPLYVVARPEIAIVFCYDKPFDSVWHTGSGCRSRCCRYRSWLKQRRLNGDDDGRGNDLEELMMKSNSAANVPIEDERDEDAVDDQRLRQAKTARQIEEARTSRQLGRRRPEQRILNGGDEGAHGVRRRYLHWR